MICSMSVSYLVSVCYLVCEALAHYKIWSLWNRSSVLRCPKSGAVFVPNLCF